MAIPSARLIQDQNIGSRFTSTLFEHNVPVLGEKTDGAKAQKKRWLGSRKTLNDISNSRQPSTFQVAKKHNSNNVISKTPFVVGGKLNVSKQTQKGQSSGRKALSNLPYSRKSSLQQVAKNRSKEIDIEKEGFLHNHHECVKAQKTVMDKDFFLKFVGLDDGGPFLPPASKSRRRSPTKVWEMKEIPVPSLGGEDQVPKGGGAQSCLPKAVLCSRELTL